MWSFLHYFVSPKKFLQLTQIINPWLTVLFLALFSYGVIDGLFVAPADYLQGDAFRIIYVHAPCAFLSLFIYSVMACAAIGSLIWRLKITAAVIKHSTILGASFTLLALITGSLWGKPMWGTWWIWDARLTSELILLFLYLGIFLLQHALAQKNKSEQTLAILILVGFADIPIIHYSVYWWNTLHQGASLKLFAPSTIDPSMRNPLLAMLIAFLIYYFLVISLRLRYEFIAQQEYAHWLSE